MTRVKFTYPLRYCTGQSSTSWANNSEWWPTSVPCQHQRHTGLGWHGVGRSSDGRRGHPCVGQGPRTRGWDWL